MCINYISYQYTRARACTAYNKVIISFRQQKRANHIIVKSNDLLLLDSKMDLYGKDKGNVSLPKRLQPPDFDETKLENVIINTQTRFYDLKIAETIKRIQRYLLKNNGFGLSALIYINLCNN